MQDGIDMNNLLISPQRSLQDLHPSHFDPISADHDFLDQMFSSIPPTSCSWPELNPSDLSPTNEHPGDSNGAAAFNHFGESPLLASKLRHHQTGAGSSGPSSAAKAMMLQQQMLMMARGFDRPHGDVQGGDDSMYNGFVGSLHGGPHFPHPQGGNQSFAAEAQGTKPAPVASGSTAASGDGGTGKPKQQRVRARRGQATDPHSIAERLRRERIAERMKALQELVPNANKTDKASMLDEIIDYVKFIQLQVKVLSMSRLGSARAAAVAPMVALADHQDASGECRIKGSGGDSSMAVTENQVAKLLEEDMGSAMQYLQGKGLCLMPISLATAISTATCLNPTTMPPGSHGNGDGPTSPNMSALTVQSSAAAANGGGSDGSSAKDTEP